MDIDWNVPLINGLTDSPFFSIESYRKYSVCAEATKEHTKCRPSSSSVTIQSASGHSLASSGHSLASGSNPRACGAKLNLKIPFPRPSSLTGDEQNIYLELSEKFQTARPTSQDEFKQLSYLNELHKRVIEEQEEFMKYLEDCALKNADVYNRIDPIASRFIEDYLASRRKDVLSYPCFYTLLDAVPLISTKHVPDIGFEHLSTLLEMGIIPRTFLPKIGPQHRRTKLLLDYSKMATHYPLKPEVQKISKFPVLSEDENAERLAIKYNAQLVISSSSLQCLIDNQPPNFQRQWEIPIVIKEHIIPPSNADSDAAGKPQKLKIVYVDKPFVGKCMTNYDKNVLFHRLALKAFVLHPTHPLSMKLESKSEVLHEAELELDPETEAAAETEIFGGTETSLDELETFGTTGNAKPSLGGKSEKLSPGQSESSCGSESENSSSETIDEEEEFPRANYDLDFPDPPSPIMSTDGQFDEKPESVKSPRRSQRVAAKQVQGHGSPHSDNRSTEAKPKRVRRRSARSNHSGSQRGLDVNSDNVDDDDDDDDEKSQLFIDLASPSHDPSAEKDSATKDGTPAKKNDRLSSESETESHDILVGAAVHKTDHRKLKVSAQKQQKIRSMKCSKNSVENPLELESPMSPEGTDAGISRKRTASCDSGEPVSTANDDIMTGKVSRERVKNEAQDSNFDDNSESEISFSSPSCTSMEPCGIAELKAENRAIDNKQPESGKLSEDAGITENSEVGSSAALSQEIPLEVPLKRKRGRPRKNPVMQLPDSISAIKPKVTPSLRLSSVLAQLAKDSQKPTKDPPVTSGGKGNTTAEVSLEVKSPPRTTMTSTPTAVRTPVSVCTTPCTAPSLTPVASVENDSITAKFPAALPGKVRIARTSSVISERPPPPAAGSEPRPKAATSTAPASQLTANVEPSKMFQSPLDQILVDQRRMFDFTRPSTPQLPQDTKPSMPPSSVALAANRFYTGYTARIKKEAPPNAALLAEKNSAAAAEFPPYSKVPPSNYGRVPPSNYGRVPPPPATEPHTTTSTGQTSDNGFDKWKPVENPSLFTSPRKGNVAYQLCQLGNLRIIVRHHYHGVFRPGKNKETFLVHLMPKMEYQLVHGVEQLTYGEVVRGWLAFQLRDNIRLARVHVDALTSELAVFNVIDEEKFRGEVPTFNPSLVVSSLHTILERLTHLDAGYHLISHMPGSTHMQIKKTTKSQSGVYDLHLAYRSGPEPPRTTSIPWIRINTSVKMPYHEKFRRIPCTFEPRDSARVNTIRPNALQMSGSAAFHKPTKKKKKNKISPSRC